MDVLGGFDRGHGRGDILRRTDLCPGAAACADRLHAEPVSEYRVVSSLIESRSGQREPRCKKALAIPQLDERRELVDREEVPDAIAERFGDVAGIVGERVRGVTALPTAAILQRLGQVPMVERGKWLDAIGEQLVDQ